MAQKDIYEQKRTIQFPGMTARIYRPVLTAEERSRRMAAIYAQAERLLKKVN